MAALRTRWSKDETQLRCGIRDCNQVLAIYHDDALRWIARFRPTKRRADLYEVDATKVAILKRGGQTSLGGRPVDGADVKCPKCGNVQPIKLDRDAIGPPPAD